MPDIAMCQNEKCSRRKDCYRHTANPSKYQSYGEFEEKDCKYFWDNKKSKNSK